MAAVSSFLYDGIKGGLGISSLISGVNINTSVWSSTGAACSFIWTLVTGSYVPAENHVYLSAFSGSELSSTSFTGGHAGTIRLPVAARVLNYNTTSHQAEFQANSVTWSGISAGVAAAFIIGQAFASDGNSVLITYNSLAGFPIATNGTNLTLAPTSAGIFAGVDFTS